MEHNLEDFRGSVAFWKGIAASTRFNLSLADNPYPPEYDDYVKWMKGHEYGQQIVVSKLTREIE